MSNPSYYVGISNPGSIVSSSTNTTMSFNGLTANTNYNFYVYGVYSTNLTTSINSYGITTIPTPPSSLLVSSITNTGAALSFTPVTQGTAYDISYSLSGGGSTVSTISPFTVTSLVGNTSYTLGVTAATPIGSSTTNASSFTTIPTPPTLLSVYSITNTGAGLSFSPVTQGTAYDISYSLSGGGSTVSTISPFTVTSLVGNTSYTLGVTVATPIGSSTSDAPSFITSVSPPTLLSVSSITNTGAALTFTKNNGTAYSIYYSLAGGGSTTSTTSPFAVTGLIGNTSYRLGVAAVANSVSQTGYADAFITKVSPPTALSVSSITNTGATLTFSRNNGTAYAITFTLTGGGSTTSTTSPFIVTGLTGGGYYVLAVTATANNISQSAITSGFFTLPSFSYSYSGATQTTSGSNIILTYTGSGSITVSGTNLTISYIVVGGGGGGGGSCNGIKSGGGGGGGGQLNSSTATLTPGTYTITIGTGGTAGASSNTSTQGTAGNGGNSSISSVVTSYGGNGGSRTTSSSSGATGGSYFAAGGKGGPGAAAGTTGLTYTPPGAYYANVGSGGGGGGNGGSNVNWGSPGSSSGGGGAGNTNYTGSNATHYGCGGGGAPGALGTPTSIGQTGGSGKSGLVVIWW